jgi:hypothetical protein
VGTQLVLTRRGTPQEAAILGMHTFFLFTRTLLSIYVAYIDGTFHAYTTTTKMMMATTHCAGAVSCVCFGNRKSLSHSGV